MDDHWSSPAAILRNVSWSFQKWFFSVVKRRLNLLISSVRSFVHLGPNPDKRLATSALNIKGSGTICKIGKFLNFMTIRLNSIRRPQVVTRLWDRDASYHPISVIRSYCTAGQWTLNSLKIANIFKIKKTLVFVYMYHCTRLYWI